MKEPNSGWNGNSHVNMANRGGLHLQAGSARIGQCQRAAPILYAIVSGESLVQNDWQ